MRHRGSVFSGSFLLLVVLCLVAPLFAKADADELPLAKADKAADATAPETTAPDTAPAADTAAPDTTTAAPADTSHARVVNLSLVKGIVIERKPGAMKWERVTLNVPIEEGASLATGRGSIAEVQFENGSTVRIGELSRLDFKEMRLAPNSGHVNHLTLALGLATLHVIPERHDEYVLSAAGASLTPSGKAEFRTDFRRGHLRVEVFHGHVQVADAGQADSQTDHQTEKLGQNRILACDTAASSRCQVTEPIKTDDWDKWVEARDQQLELAADGDQEMPPGALLYRWEEGLVLYGGMGALPTDGN